MRKETAGNKKKMLRTAGDDGSEKTFNWRCVKCRTCRKHRFESCSRREKKSVYDTFKNFCSHAFDRKRFILGLNGEQISLFFGQANEKNGAKQYILLISKSPLSPRCSEWKEQFSISFLRPDFALNNFSLLFGMLKGALNIYCRRIQ